MFGIVMFLVILPKSIGPEPEPSAYRRLVVKNTIFYSVRFAGVVEHQTLVILCTRIHNLTEHVKGWKYAEKRLVQTFSILNNVLAENKHVIDVRSKIRGKIHTVLHSQHEKQFPVSSVHETLSNTRVLHERFIIHAVIHQQKST